MDEKELLDQLFFLPTRHIMFTQFTSLKSRGRTVHSALDASEVNSEHVQNFMMCDCTEDFEESDISVYRQLTAEELQIVVK